MIFMVYRIMRVYIAITIKIQAVRQWVESGTTGDSIMEMTYMKNRFILNTKKFKENNFLEQNKLRHGAQSSLN